MFKRFAFQSPKAPPPLKVLFVGVNEQDTAFLTQGAALDVVRRSSTADLRLENERYDAVVVDVDNSRTESFRSLKKSLGTAVFMLADSGEVPRAIDYVRQGADGFLVRGITNPTSFVRLTQLAKARY